MTTNPAPSTRQRPLRILMVSNMYPTSEDPGYGIYVYDLVEELRRLGAAVELLVVSSKPRTLIERAIKYARLFLKACQYRKGAFDVVHLHFPQTSHLLAASPVLLGSGKPYVLTIHRGEVHEIPRTGLRSGLASWFWRRAYRVIAVSRELANMLQDDFGVQERRIEIINVGCNTSLFTPAMPARKGDLRQQLGFSTDRFSILFVGTLEPRKGLVTLFKALEALSPQCSVELFLVGIGPSEHELKERVRNHPLSEHIHWLGALSHDQLPGYYAAADAFVLPSRAEGTPTVLLEAMASNVPVIITRVGGVPDVVQHEVNGLLFDPDDSETLRRLIEQLQADTELAHRLARNAAKDVEEHSLTRQTMRIEAIYRAATAESSAPNSSTTLA